LLLLFFLLWIILRTSGYDRQKSSDGFRIRGSSADFSVELRNDTSTEIFEIRTFPTTVTVAEATLLINFRVTMTVMINSVSPEPFAAQLTL